MPAIPKYNPRNINFILLDGSLNKFEYLSQADLCIVPSFYESYSMVISESIASDTLVLTWKHIGACEFYPKNMVNTAFSFSKISLRKKFEQSICLKNDVFNVYLGHKKRQEFNSIYVKSIRHMVEKKELNYEKNFVDKLDFYFYFLFFTFIRWRLIMGKKLRKYRGYLHSKINVAIKKQANPYKLLGASRKIIENSYSFFKDTKITKNNHVLNDFIDKSFLSNVEAANSIKNDKNKGQVTNEFDFNRNFYTYIKSNEKITFSNIDIQKNSNLIVFNDSGLKTLRDLKNEYHRCNEKFLLSRNNLVAKFKVDKVTDEFDIFNFVDFSKLENLNKFQTIILVNPTDDIVNFFYYSTFNVTLIGVFTYHSSISFEKLKLIDNIILYHNISYNTCSFQTVYYYNDCKDLKIYLDKFIKYNIPREHDYLLPIYGISSDYNELYLNFDKLSYDGFLIIESDIEGGNKSFKQTVFESIKEVKVVGLVESVYNKYPSVIMEIHEGNNILENILFLLGKGVRFNVIN